MKKNSYFYSVVLFAVGALCGCVHDEHETPAEQTQCPELTVDDARAFFETNSLDGLTRAAADESQMGVFALGEVVPDWDRAESSSNERLASVDIPSRIGNVFRILRRDAAGEFHELSVFHKLLVVRSAETDELATYMHFFIPDELYASWYSGDIGAMFANSEPRGDYSGIELYTTIDGTIAAAARYVEGKPTTQIFLGDKRLSHDDRQRRLRDIIQGLFFMRRAETATRASDWWDFAGRECYYDSTGALYYVIATDVGLAATMDFDNLWDCVNGEAVFKGTTTGGGSGGSSGGGSGGSSGGSSGGGSGGGGDTGGPTGPGPGGPTGPTGPGPGGTGTGGGGGGGSGGGGSTGGNNNGDGDGDGNDDGDSGDGDGNDDGDSGDGDGNDDGDSGDKPIFKPGDGDIEIKDGDFKPIRPVDPLPWQPWTPDILPDDGGGGGKIDPEEPKEKKPCFDLAQVRADPLINMKIFGTKNNGIKGGRYGTGRGKKHNGLDLDAAIGTPVYVMFSGKVTGVVNKYDPNLPYNQYKHVYASDDSRNYNAGNRIWIQSTTSKGTILIKFFHLDNICVTLNQQVSVGDVIGYSGATGSACSPDSAGPHLHVEAYLNGKLIDPEEVLYTRFDETGNIISVDCLKEIKL